MPWLVANGLLPARAAGARGPGAGAGAGAGVVGAAGGAGRAAAFLAAGLAAAFFGGGAASAGKASFNLRTTGASMVDDADRTNSPNSSSLAMMALPSTPTALPRS